MEFNIRPMLDDIAKIGGSGGRYNIQLYVLLMADGSIASPDTVVDE